MRKLTSLVMTCGACPSQWEGTFADGKKFYARYRHGWFGAGVGTTDGDALNGCMYKPEYILGDGEHICSFEIGDPYDGVMSTETMLGILKDYVDVSAI